MADLSDLASFALVAGLVTIIPGLDTALVVRTTATQGRPQGFAAAFGIITGVLVWGAAAAVGISALLAASRLAYDFLRAIGAAYLVWLGTTMVWRTWRRRGTAGHGTAGRDADAAGLIWFSALITAVHFARRFLDSSRVHKIMDRITGTVLIGFGLKLALSNR